MQLIIISIDVNRIIKARVGTITALKTLNNQKYLCLSMLKNENLKKVKLHPQLSIFPKNNLYSYKNTVKC